MGASDDEVIVTFIYPGIDICSIRQLLNYVLVGAVISSTLYIYTYILLFYGKKTEIYVKLCSLQFNIILLADRLHTCVIEFGVRL